MKEQKLKRLKVAILADTDFEQAEFVEPKKALEEAGAEVVVISSQSGEIEGMNHDQKADKFPVDLTLDEANPDDFQALVLPGGAFNADHLRINPQAQEFVKKFDSEGKPLAIICHAPWLLVSAGLVKGRRLTSYHTIQDDIKNAGGDWEDSEVVVDKNWLSSRQPSDLPAFNTEMIDLFSKSRA